MLNSYQTREQLVAARGQSKTPSSARSHQSEGAEPEKENEKSKTTVTAVSVESDVRNVTDVSTRASGSLLQTISNLSEDMYNQPNAQVWKKTFVDQRLA